MQMSYSLKFCQLCTNHFLGMVSTPCRDPQRHRKDSNVYLMKPQAMPVGCVTAPSMHGRERHRKDSKEYLMKPQHAMGCVTAFSMPGGERQRKKCSAVFFEKAGKRHHQSEEWWNRFKGNAAKTFKKRG